MVLVKLIGSVPKYFNTLNEKPTIVDGHISVARRDIEHLGVASALFAKEKAIYVPRVLAQRIGRYPPETPDFGTLLWEFADKLRVVLVIEARARHCVACSAETYGPTPFSR